jgi:hypothetical protein
MIRSVAAVVVLLATTVAAGRPREATHPSDDTEVFTGGEDVAGGEAPQRPALAYWRVRATLRVPATTEPLRVGLLVPLSDGRQDVVARRTVAPGLRFREAGAGTNLRAEWSGTPAKPVDIS